MTTWIVLVFVGLILLFAGWVVWRKRRYLAESLTKVRLAAGGSPAGSDSRQDVPDAWHQALHTASAVVTVPASRNGSTVAGATAVADLLRFGSESHPSRVGSRSRGTAHTPRHLPGARQATRLASADSITTSPSEAVSPRWTYRERRVGLADRIWHRRSFGDGLPPPQEIAAKLQQVTLELARADNGPSGSLEHSLAPSASCTVADKAGRTRSRWPMALAMASSLRAPGARTEWALEIEWTPSGSAEAPLVRAARQPSRARTKPGRPSRIQHTRNSRKDVAGEDARNPTIILIDTAVLDVLIAAMLGPPSSDAIYLHNLITVIEIAIQPRKLVIKAVTMTVGAMLNAHGLGMLTPGAGRILTRILIPVLNLILGPSGRHGTLLKILDDLDIGFNTFKGRPTDSTVFRSDLADWLAGARGATPHSAHRPSTAYAPPPPSGRPAHEPARGAPSRPSRHERAGAPWPPAWVTGSPATPHQTDFATSPTRPGHTGSGYRSPTTTGHFTPAAAAATWPPWPLSSSSDKGTFGPVAPPSSPPVDNPEELPRQASLSAADLQSATPPTTAPQPSADAPKPPPAVTHPTQRPSAPIPVGLPGNVAPRFDPVQVAQAASESGNSIPSTRRVIRGQRHTASAAPASTPQLPPPTGSGKPSLQGNTAGSAPAKLSADGGPLSDVAKHIGRPTAGQATLESGESVRPASAGPSVGGGTVPPATTAGRRQRHSGDEPLVLEGPASIHTIEPTERRPGDRTPPRRLLEARIKRRAASEPTPSRAPGPRAAGGAASPR